LHPFQHSRPRLKLILEKLPRSAFGL
jgi:hypothetical protein